MSLKSVIIALILLSLTGSCFAARRAEERLRLYDLTCEYLKNPKGIDERQPRLGWKLKSLMAGLYGQRQQAYRIIVASSRELLDKNKDDMWDSKWTHSSQTQQVLYNGQSLFSDRTYYWKVCIKDEQSKISAWSEPNTFTTGFFEHNEWLDQWILGHDQNARECEHKANAAAGAIHRKFFDAGNNTYSDGSAANLAMALLAEVVPASLRSKVMQSLES